MKPKFAFRIRSVCSATRKPPASQGRSRSLRRIAPPSTALLCGIAIALTSNAPATTITWIGGNADWVDGGTGAGLWSPADEPDSNDDVIFNTDDTVKLGSNNTVLSLALSGSIILETNDFDLTVDGLLQLAGSGTNLTIGGSASSVVVDSAVINSGGRIILEDGALRIVEETGAGLLDINSGGSLSGQGAIHFDDALAVATTLMRNDGTLAASYVGLFQSGMLPPAGTLTIPAGSAYARIDLDGTSGNGIVTVGRNQTLDLNVALSDPFSGDLNLFHRSTIDVSTPWSIDASSTVDIDNGALTGFPAIAADTSYIAGVSFIQNGGTITVIDTDGTLQFDAPFTQNGGDLVNNGLVVFNADATIGTGANLTMPGSTSSLTVNPGVTVNIDQPEFNADGTGSINNVLTVESGGNLDLDLGTGADASLTGSIRLNGGELDVTTGTDSWTINGPVTMGANSGTSQINGEAVTFTSTAVTLGENSVLRVNAASTLSPTASFAVATNATLGFPTAPVFNGASFTGDGIMRVEGASEVAADTTIGVHFFDWDWNALGQTHRINAGVTFTINSPVWMDPMDDSVMLVGGGSTLNVNGPTAWNMDGTLVSNPAASTTATVGGTSHANFGGAINANSGNTLVTAPATLAATSTINVGPGALLSFNSNTIFEGGASSGSGILRVGSTSNINADTTIDVDTFDWDGTGVGSLQSISDGVTFTINSANFDTDGDMDDPIKLGGNGATLAVNGPASWTMLRTLTTNLADTGVATITGSSRLILTSATGSLVADGDTTVDAPITLGPSSVTDVAASAVLALNSGGTVFDGGTVTGAGALQVSSSSVVTADTLIDVNTFDWDGPFVGSLQSIGDGVTLTIESPVWDDDGDMDDPITLGQQASLVVNGPTSWEMKGILTASPTAGSPAIVGGTSRMILTTGTGIINVNGGLRITAPVSFGPSSQANVAAATTLTVQGTANYDGGTITGPGTFWPPLTNYVYSSSTISTTNFDFDYGTWTLNGGDLMIAVDDYELGAGTNSFDATISINDATLKVTSADPTFVMDGTMNCHSSGVNAAWGSGSDPLAIGNHTGTSDANLNVSGLGYTQIATDIVFQSDADVDIAAGATLQLLNNATFNSVNGANNAEFTGGGHLQTNRAVYFNQATTFNMPGGSIDLDGSDAFGDTIYIMAPVVINAATMESFGNSNLSGSNILDVSHSTTTGSLTVNLDSPTAEWTLNTPGVLALNNNAAAAAVTLLAGSDANLNGYVQVRGDVRSEARLDIGGVVDVLTAGKPFRLAGGDLTDTNTLVGGTINGPGLLGADSLSSLVGYGTIHPDIDFDGSSDLLADNGTLTINGSILDARYVGTADSDGILNLANAWNSSVVNALQMQGGELKGGILTIGNANGIIGRGRVSSRVVNNTKIEVTGAGETLLVETVGNDNDLDGTSETGILGANQGTLELRDDTAFVFNGTINALNGGTVFANGFELSPETGSTLSLANGGRFLQSGGIATHLRGTILVGTGNPPLLMTSGAGGSFHFMSGSTTTLDGSLHLSDSTTVIQSAATFGGAGSLVNLSGSQLSPDAGANVNVLVENRSRYTPAGSGVGRNDLRDFQQTATGTLAIDLQGTGLNEFDRVLVNGSAQVAGKLALLLGGGYVPALNDTFVILSATAGVTGTFAPPIQPADMPAGLAFEVSYTPTNVQLKVVSSGSPFDRWFNLFPALTDPADKTKAANPDGDSLNNLGEFALDGDPTSGANNGKVVGRIAPVGGVDALTLTLPVRNGTVLDPADPADGELGLKQAADGLFYQIQASDPLTAWTLTVTEVTGPDAAAIQLGLPALTSGWTYRTFQSPGPVAGDPKEFIRVKISD